MAVGIGLQTLLRQTRIFQIAPKCLASFAMIAEKNGIEKSKSGSGIFSLRAPGGVSLTRITATKAVFPFLPFGFDANNASFNSIDIDQAVFEGKVRSTPLINFARQNSGVTTMHLHQIQALVDFTSFILLHPQNGMHQELVGDEIQSEQNLEGVHQKLMQTIGENPKVQQLMKLLLNVMVARFQPDDHSISTGEHQLKPVKPFFNEKVQQQAIKRAQGFLKQTPMPYKSVMNEITDIVCMKMVRTNLCHPNPKHDSGVLCYYEPQDGSYRTLISLSNKTTMVEFRLGKIASGGTRLVQNLSQLNEVVRLAKAQQDKHGLWMLPYDGAKRTFSIYVDDHQIPYVLRDAATCYSQTFDTFEINPKNSTMEKLYAPVVSLNGFDGLSFWGPDVKTGSKKAISEANRGAEIGGRKHGLHMSGGAADIPHAYYDFEKKRRLGITSEGAFYSNFGHILAMVNKCKEEDRVMKVNMIGGPDGDVGGSTLSLFADLEAQVIPNLAYDGRSAVFFDENSILSNPEGFKKIILSMNEKFMPWSAYIKAVDGDENLSEKDRIELKSMLKIYSFDSEGQITLPRIGLDSSLEKLLPQLRPAVEMKDGVYQLDRNQFTQLLWRQKVDIQLSCGHGTWVVSDDETQKSQFPGAVTVQELEDSSCEMVFSPANLTCSESAQREIQENGKVMSLSPEYENGGGTAASRASAIYNIQGCQINQTVINAFREKVRYFAVARSGYLLNYILPKSANLYEALQSLRQQHSEVSRAVLSETRESSNLLLSRDEKMKEMITLMYFPSEDAGRLLQAVRNGQLEAKPLLEWWSATRNEVGLTKTNLLYYSANPDSMQNNEAMQHLKQALSEKAQQKCESVSASVDQKNFDFSFIQWMMWPLTYWLH